MANQGSWNNQGTVNKPFPVQAGFPRPGAHPAPPGVPGMGLPPGARPPFAGTGGPQGGFPRGPPSGPGVMQSGMQPHPFQPRPGGFPRPVGGPDSSPVLNQGLPLRPPHSPTAGLGMRPPGSPQMSRPQATPPKSGPPMMGGFRPQMAPPGPLPAQPGIGPRGPPPPMSSQPMRPSVPGMVGHGQQGPGLGPRGPGMGGQPMVPGPGPMQGAMGVPGYGPMGPPGPGGIAVPGSGPMQPMGAPGFGQPPMGRGMPPRTFPAPPGTPLPQLQPTLDKFESLTLGPSAPGARELINDASTLPRPQPEDFPSLFDPPPFLEPTNCHPDFMRPTVYAIPKSGTLRDRLHLPLGVIVQPLSEGNGTPKVPLIKLESGGIIRCRRCRTYINPHVGWGDGGRRWTCNVCKCVNDVPMEYFCTLDNNGKRRDLAERPELFGGSVEYVAPPEYMVRAPMPTVYFFVIDVSHAAIQSGMVKRVAETIQETLDTLPGDDRKQIGFLTFDSTLHFYSLKSTLPQPQMLVVPEVDDPFVPQPDDLLVNLKESRELVDNLLSSLESNFAESRTVESAMGSALQAAFMVMQHIGGKILLFLSSVPSVGPGKIKNRDNPAMYGTDRESNLRNPEDSFYKRFAAECSRVQISVDTFAFGSQFMDLASITCLPRYTGGQVYYYPGFYGPRDGHKLKSELKHNLTRTTGWEAVMRIRCSKGVRITSFNGHFFIRSSDLLALPTVDVDKAFAVQLGHEEQVLETDETYIQCALLYTASCGERRIRVHTLKLPVTHDMTELFQKADAPAMTTLLAKLGVEKSYSTRLDETRRALETKLVSGLREYRVLHSSHFRGVNKMIYPERLRFLCLWVLGVLKCAALRGGAADVQADERMAVGFEVIASSVKHVIQLIHPRLYALGDFKGDWPGSGKDGKVHLPPTMPLSLEFLNPAGLYLMDNGRVFILWIGRNAPKELVSKLFGLDSGAAPNKDITQIPVEPARENPISKKFCALLDTLRKGKSAHPQCFVVPQGSQIEVHTMPYFVEDRMHSAHSYLDFVTHVHRSIGAKQ